MSTDSETIIGRNAPDFYCAEQLDCGGKLLSLSIPQVMGVLNVTPDSFSDGGRFANDGSGKKVAATKAVDAALKMVEQGASIIDVGGESTRPGAKSVGLQEELDRVIPVVEKITERSDAIVSVDTSSPEVMLAAAAAGAGMLNDVRALNRDGALEAAKQTGLPVCLMHMQGMPSSMQANPSYEDVVAEVSTYLQLRINACLEAGINQSKLVIDPGFGFGKTLEHNLMLFNGLPDLLKLGYPLLVGVSRKSMIGAITGQPVENRLAGSVVLAAQAVQRGANILRVHDVDQTVDVMKILAALEGEQ